MEIRSKFANWKYFLIYSLSKFINSLVGSTTKRFPEQKFGITM